MVGCVALGSALIFAAGETARLQACLARLLPHLEGAGCALTGGVAVEYHLANAGRAGLRASIADLDFVAHDLDAVSPDVTRDFLVSHHHRVGPNVPKALLQLVDPATRLRIDIFPNLDGVLSRAERVGIAGISASLLHPASILEHKLRTIAKASAQSPVDPKHRRDALALATMLGRHVSISTDFEAPGALCVDVGAGCARCDASSSAALRLAPKRAIFELLGYV